MDFLNSFFSNIKDKLTNPFFGTLIMVILIHHWELWYTIFNFDDGYELSNKTVIINNYVANHLTTAIFITDIIKAALIMILGYLVIIGTRCITMWIEFFLMPFVTGKIVNKNVVRKEEFDDVVKEREQYFDQYEEQRIRVREFSKTIDEQTTQIKEKDKNYVAQSNTVNKLQRELELFSLQIDGANTKYEELIKSNSDLSNLYHDVNSKNENNLKRLEQYDSLFFSDESKLFYDSIYKLPVPVIKKIRELDKEKLIEVFNNFGNYIDYGRPVNQSEIDLIIDKDLAYIENETLKFTPIGRILWQFRNTYNNKSK